MNLRNRNTQKHQTRSPFQPPLVTAETNGSQSLFHQ
jgi:hypothetical protein